MAKLKKGKKGGILKAAVAGVALGAAAGAAAVALSDKKNRLKIKKTIKDLQSKGAKSLVEARKKIKSASEESKKRLSEEIAKAGKKLS